MILVVITALCRCCREVRKTWAPGSGSSKYLDELRLQIATNIILKDSRCSLVPIHFDSESQDFTQNWFSIDRLHLIMGLLKKMDSFPAGLRSNDLTEENKNKHHSSSQRMMEDIQ